MKNCSLLRKTLSHTNCDDTCSFLKAHFPKNALEKIPGVSFNDYSRRGVIFLRTNIAASIVPAMLTMVANYTKFSMDALSYYSMNVKTVSSTYAWLQCPQISHISAPSVPSLCNQSERQTINKWEAKSDTSHQPGRNTIGHMTALFSVCV